MTNTSSSHPALTLQDARAKAKLKLLLAASKSAFSKSELVAFGGARR